MQRQKEEDDLKVQSEIDEMREKLDNANDRILVLSSNEDSIKVYQKKIENMT